MCRNIGTQLQTGKKKENSNKKEKHTQKIQQMHSKPKSQCGA